MNHSLDEVLSREPQKNPRKEACASLGCALVFVASTLTFTASPQIYHYLQSHYPAIAEKIDAALHYKPF